jgi:putative oxidoreductase
MERTLRFLAERRPILRDVGLLWVRLFIGFGIAAHGAAKLGLIGGGHGPADFAGFLVQLGVPSPLLMAWLAALAEFLGGLALAAGFLTRLAWIPPTIVMFVAITQVHWGNGYFLTHQPPGMEYPLNLAAVFIALGLMGAGRFSLDWLLVRLWRRWREYRSREAMATLATQLLPALATTTGSGIRPRGAASGGLSRFISGIGTPGLFWSDDG